MAVDCPGLFASLPVEGDEAKSNALTVDQAAPRCECEACALSRFGPVQEAEELLRLVVSPWHVDRKTGKPTASALTQSETFGMSVYRAAHVTDAELLLTAQELVETARQKDPRVGIFGVIRMVNRDIKIIADDPGSPCYCVYDTEMDKKPAHSDVFVQRDRLDEAMKLEARKELFRRTAPFYEKVATFRNGLLMKYAPPNP